MSATPEITASTPTKKDPESTIKTNASAPGSERKQWIMQLVHVTLICLGAFLGLSLVISVVHKWTVSRKWGSGVVNPEDTQSGTMPPNPNLEELIVFENFIERVRTLDPPAYVNGVYPEKPYTEYGIPEVKADRNAWHLIEETKNRDGHTTLGAISPDSKFYEGLTEHNTINKEMLCFLQKLMDIALSYDHSKMFSVSAGRAVDAGGPRREWYTAVWRFLTFEQLGLTLWPDRNRTAVFLNPAISQDEPVPGMLGWFVAQPPFNLPLLSSLVMRFWGMAMSVQEGFIPYPILDGRCLAMYFAGPSSLFDDWEDNEAKRAFLIAYLRQADASFNAFMARIELIAYRAVGADEKANFDLDETRRLLKNVSSATGNDPFYRNLVEGKLPSSEEELMDMEDVGTKRIIEYFMSNLYLDKPSLESVKEQHDVKSIFQEEEGKNFDEMLGSISVFEHIKSRLWKAKDDYKVRTFMAAAEVDEKQIVRSFRLDLPKKFLRDYARLLLDVIPDAYIRLFLEQREFLRSQDSQSFSKIFSRRSDWNRVCGAALQMQPVRLSKQDLIDGLSMGNCSRFGKIFRSTPDAKGNRRHLNPTEFLIEALDILEKADQTIAALQDSNPEQEEIAYQLPNTDMVFKPTPCGLTWIEAFSLHKRGQISPSAVGNVLRLEIRCEPSSIAGSPIARNVTSVHTCHSAFELNCAYSGLVNNITMEELLGEFFMEPCAFAYNRG